MTKKTSALIRLIASSLVALILIGILLTGILGKGFHFNSNFSFGFGNHYDNAGDYSAGNGSVAADTLNDLEINWISGEINILPTDGAEIEIQERSSGNLEKKDKLHYLYRDGKLTIQYKESNTWFNLFSFSSQEDKKLEVKIPRRLISQLSDVRVDSTSADINISDLTTKKLSLDNVSGTVTGKNVTVSERVDSDTVSGSISMEGSLSNIDSESVSGSCTYISAVTPRSVDMESVSGDITLTLPENSNFKAEYDTVSGDFNCNFSTTNKEDSVICGDGKNDFDFETVSGDISLSPLLTATEQEQSGK